MGKTAAVKATALCHPMPKTARAPVGLRGMSGPDPTPIDHPWTTTRNLRCGARTRM